MISKTVGLVIFLFLWVFTLLPFAEAKDPTYTVGMGHEKCTSFLHEYSIGFIKEGDTTTIKHNISMRMQWLFGYMTATNQHLKSNLFEKYGGWEAISWVASWCRDNPDKTFHEAADAMSKGGVNNLK